MSLFGPPESTGRAYWANTVKRRVYLEEDLTPDGHICASDTYVACLSGGELQILNLQTGATVAYMAPPDTTSITINRLTRGDTMLSITVSAGEFDTYELLSTATAMSVVRGELHWRVYDFIGMSDVAFVEVPEGFMRYNYAEDAVIPDSQCQAYSVAEDGTVYVIGMDNRLSVVGSSDTFDIIGDDVDATASPWLSVGSVKVGEALRLVAAVAYTRRDGTEAIAVRDMNTGATNSRTVWLEKDKADVIRVRADTIFVNTLFDGPIRLDPLTLAVTHRPDPARKLRDIITCTRDGAYMTATTWANNDYVVINHSLQELLVLPILTKAFFTRSGDLVVVTGKRRATVKVLTRVPAKYVTHRWLARSVSHTMKEDFGRKFNLLSDVIDAVAKDSTISLAMAERIRKHMLLADWSVPYEGDAVERLRPLKLKIHATDVDVSVALSDEAYRNGPFAVGRDDDGPFAGDRGAMSDDYRHDIGTSEDPMLADIAAFELLEHVGKGLNSGWAAIRPAAIHSPEDVRLAVRVAYIAEWLGAEGSLDVMCAVMARAIWLKDDVYGGREQAEATVRSVLGLPPKPVTSEYTGWMSWLHDAKAWLNGKRKRDN